MFKRLRLLSVLLTIFTSLNVLSQAPSVEWTKIFGGDSLDRGNDICQTMDGGYIILGTTESFGSGGGDVYLTKLNSMGDIQWQETHGGSGYDEGTSILQNQGGGFIITGATESYGFGDSDVYLIKTDSLGNESWTKTFGGNSYDKGGCIRKTDDGGYVIAGATNSYGAGGRNVYLIKTDSMGNTQWQKTFGGDSMDVGKSVQQTPDKGFIIIGLTYSNGEPYSDFYLVKTDSMGNMEWDTTYGDFGYDYGRSIQVTDDGGYIMTGYMDYCPMNNTYVYLVKTDNSGNIEWDKNVGGDSYAKSGYSVQQTTDKGYVVTGESWSMGIAYSKDIYLLKTDSLGNIEWDTTFGDTLCNEYGNSVRQTSDGGYIIAGLNHVNVDDSSDVYVMKVYPESGIGYEEGNDNFYISTINPNPFFHKTILKYKIKVKSQVDIDIYNQLGQKVIDVYSASNNPGIYSLVWDGKNSSGETVPGGIYFFNIKAGGKKETEKVILIR